MKRILIVDDDRAFLESLAGILKSQGYSVDVAETGREAIDKSKETYYNLALLDIRLPDMDGTELLRLIDGHLPKTVKIIVTGYPSVENAVKALNMNADGYVTKPTNPLELLGIIRKKLQDQEEADRALGEKVKEWIERCAKQQEA
ncbi:MAG: response regulator [Candidatus Bathyarchaeia archaeon]